MRHLATSSGSVSRSCAAWPRSRAPRLVVYAFTFAVYAQASGASQEVAQRRIAIVDEDRSAAVARPSQGPFCRPISSRRDRSPRMRSTACSIPRIHLRPRHSAALSARRRGRPPARTAGQCRCDGGDAGGNRRRLHRADRRGGGRPPGDALGCRRPVAVDLAVGSPSIPMSPRPGSQRHGDHQQHHDAGDRPGGRRHHFASASTARWIIC